MRLSTKAIQMPAKLWIPVGIPGCGKSTWAERTGLRTVSSDAIRETLGDVTDQTKNDLVFQRFHAAIASSLNHDEDIVADATNLRDFARARLIQLADDFKAERHVVIFANPLEAIVRNRARSRVVPEEVMYRMVDQYEKALLDIELERIHGNYTSVQKIVSYK